jgi:hypothetical protein
MITIHPAKVSSSEGNEVMIIRAKWMMIISKKMMIIRMTQSEDDDNNYEGNRHALLITSITDKQ